MVDALVLYSSVLFDRVGPPSSVRPWADRVEARFTRYAQEFAPVRSGELRAGISGTVTRTGSHELTTIIRSAAPHSLYVLKGTTGPIFSSRPNGKLRLPAGHGHPARLVKWVSGQRPQNFFLAAAQATAIRHPSLQGFRPASEGFDLV
jgi:hypothetical protein